MTMPYKNILFATDLSEVTYKMRHKVNAIQKAFNAKLNVAYVMTSFSGILKSQAMTHGIQDELETEAKALLKNFCVPLNIPESQQLIKRGHTVHSILDIIKEHQIDLLIIGRHGESGIAHLIGSVSHRLLHVAPCEIMMIDPD